jgi:hypothetical protein
MSPTANHSLTLPSLPIFIANIGKRCRLFALPYTHALQDTSKNQRPVLHFATMITPLGLGSSGVFNYHGSKVNLKWRGSIPGKGKEDMKLFIERVCAETAVKKGYSHCTIRHVLDLLYTLYPLEYSFLFPETILIITQIMHSRKYIERWGRLCQRRRSHHSYVRSSRSHESFSRQI